MADHPVGGRSLVTRRTVTEIARAAALGSYGVTGLTDPSAFSRLLRVLRLRPSGVRVRLAPVLSVELYLRVGHGLPVAEVARQVDSAVRYSIRRALGRDLTRVTIHVAGLGVQPARPDPAPAEPVAGPAQDYAPADRPEAAGR